MPSFRCKHPTCTAILAAPGWCPAHQEQGQAETQAHQAEVHRRYDREQRDPEARRFYNCDAWKRCRAAKLAAHPVCERCQQNFSAHVHHLTPVKGSTREERLDHANLLAVCAGCHNIIEGQQQDREPAPPHVAGSLTLTEDRDFFFDADAADRPIRFIEKFCRHYEGKWAGQPFELLDWQKAIIRTLFGWKARASGLRRFRELYLLTAKGAGKTPLLAAIGLYMLLGDGEAGAHVISMASSFEQANLTFDAAKKYIAECPELQNHADSKQYLIRARNHGKWSIISGKPNGRSGPRPSCVIADEAHEWPANTGQTFELLSANLFKRSQPLLMVATNAADNRTCFAWQLHERAMKVLRGESKDTTLLPVIFEASPSLEWTSEEAAKAANPSLGSIVTWAQIEPKMVQARENAAAEASYRRLYLSQWVQGTAKWLNMSQWDAACAEYDVEKVKDLPLYVGLDFSQGDDLCAALFV